MSKKFAAIFVALLVISFASIAESGDVHAWGVDLQVIGGANFLDHSGLNSYLKRYDTGKLSIASPTIGGRAGLFNDYIQTDVMIEFSWQDHSKNHTTCNMLESAGLLHFGINITRKTVYTYPFIGLGLYYSRLDLDTQLKGKSRSGQLNDMLYLFSGWKISILGEAGLGIELPIKIGKAKVAENDAKISQLTIPVTIQGGYQGDPFNTTWQKGVGKLDGTVVDKFNGFFVRAGIGFGGIKENQ